MWGRLVQLLTAFLVFMFIIFTEVHSQDKHSFDLEVVDVIVDGGDEHFIYKGFRAKRLNKTVYGIIGNMTIKEDLDDKWEVEINSYRSKLGNNQWEKTPLKFARRNACDFDENVYKENMQTDFKDISNLPQFGDGEGCPFPKGDYYIKGYRTDIRHFPNYMQDGTYKIETKFFKNGQEKTGHSIILKITPKVE